MLIYQDGIQTIIRFAGIYGAEVGVGQSAQIAAFAMVQLLGVPFAFAFGSLVLRLGTKRAIFLALGVYAGLGRHARLLHDECPALLRAGGTRRHRTRGRPGAEPLALRAPGAAGQDLGYFGFYAVVERFATVLGPMVFWLSNVLTGSSRSAVLFLIAFFVAGGWLLARVDVEAGERAAHGAG